MLESILIDCILKGKSFASAKDFYAREIAGRAYVAADEGMDLSAAAATIRKADQEELEFLQQKYSRRWSS